MWKSTISLRRNNRLFSPQGERRQAFPIFIKRIDRSTGTNVNKALRAKRDSRTCVYLYDKEGFTGISLVGKVEVSTDPVLKKQVWYDDLRAFFDEYVDENLCVLLFKPERYNIFIENTTIRGTF